MSEEMTAAELAELWKDSPADQLIEAIFQHFTNVRKDAGPDTPIPDAKTARELWHGDGALTIVFDKPNAKPIPGQCDYFVRLVRRGQIPHITDIADYTLSLEKHPALGDLLLHEWKYHPAYTV